jgi:DNA (cytosine-5)-methyltransferase 1
VTYPKIAGTLCASGAGLSRPAGMCSETDFCIVQTDVAAVDCRNMRETPEVSGTLQAKAASGGYSLNYQNPVRTGYLVRRLTPTECERLQGFPDDWTKYGASGKEISDSKRYQMLGNSVAVPCVAYLLQGITDILRGDS